MDAPSIDEEPTGGRRVGRVAAAVVGLVMVGLLVVLATSEPSTERRTSSPLLGEAVPPLVGETSDGGTFDIDDHRGEWVVVNFFASWCVPCVREHPELVRFAAAHEGDVQVVSVVFDDDPDAVRAFFAREGGDWPVVVGDTGGIALDFGVRGVPESYVVAPSGVVVAAFYGVTQAALDQVLVELGQTVPTAPPGTLASTTTTTTTTAGSAP